MNEIRVPIYYAEPWLRIASDFFYSNMDYFGILVHRHHLSLHVQSFKMKSYTWPVDVAKCLMSDLAKQLGVLPVCK